MEFRCGECFRVKDFKENTSNEYLCDVCKECTPHVIAKSRLSRVLVLADNYFNEYSAQELVDFVNTLDPEKYYNSDELIRLMADYSDENNLRQLTEEKV